MKKRDLVTLPSSLKPSDRPISYLDKINPLFGPFVKNRKGGLLEIGGGMNISVNYPASSNQSTPDSPPTSAAYVTSLYVSPSYVQNTD
jgi:hypothetical protein